MWQRIVDWVHRWQVDLAVLDQWEHATWHLQIGQVALLGVQLPNCIIHMVFIVMWGLFQTWGIHFTWFKSM